MQKHIAQQIFIFKHFTIETLQYEKNIKIKNNIHASTSLSSFINDIFCFLLFSLYLILLILIKVVVSLER